MKKIIIFLVTLLMILVVGCGDKKNMQNSTSTPLSYEQEVTSCQHNYNNGKCMECKATDPNIKGVYWMIEDDTLIIYGNGQMDDYDWLYEVNNEDVLVPIGSTAPWNEKSYTKIVIEEGVTSIGANAFVASPAVSVTIPNGISVIGNAAFQVSSLKTVELPNSITEIGYDAFKGCKSLETVEISNSISVLSSCIFEGCTILETVVIPDSVTKIDFGAFYECTSLSSVEIPDSVTKIDGNVFWGCDALQSVYIPDSVTYISFNLFDIQSREEKTIYGKAGSYAETYAIQNRYTFVAQ